MNRIDNIIFDLMQSINDLANEIKLVQEKQENLELRIKKLEHRKKKI